MISMPSRLSEPSQLAFTLPEAVHRAIAGIVGADDAELGGDDHRIWSDPSRPADEYSFVSGP